jgi:large-conductance mechanosensitive channel
MLSNVIYFVVFLILAFVLSIAVKAITRGVEAKQIIKDEKVQDLKNENENENHNLEVINQIRELKELYDNGTIDENEFKKAKDKILNNLS